MASHEISLFCWIARPSFNNYFRSPPPLFIEQMFVEPRIKCQTLISWTAISSWHQLPPCTTHPCLLSAHPCVSCTACQQSSVLLPTPQTIMLEHTFPHPHSLECPTSSQAPHHSVIRCRHLRIKRRGTSPAPGILPQGPAEEG